MQQKPLVSVVLGTYNRRSFLSYTIRDVRDELKNIPYEIIVIDGGSIDGTLAWLAKQKDIITIIQHNRGRWLGNEIERKSWGYFMNLGFKIAHGKYICMLSDDCLIVPGSIINALNLFDNKLALGEKVGAIAFYWRNWPDNKHYSISLTLGNIVYVNHGLFLKTAIADVAYAEEEAYRFYFGDSDLCLKLWEKGYLCLISEDSYIEHYTHANLFVRKSNSSYMQSDASNFYPKWKQIFPSGTTASTIDKQFIDRYNTVKTFERIHNSNLIILLVRFRRTLKRLFHNRYFSNISI